MELLRLDRRDQRGQVPPAQLFGRTSLVCRLLLISHHESETLFRVFRLCASMNRLPTFFFTPPCTRRLAWRRLFVPRDVLSSGIFCEILSFPKLPFSLEPKL